MTVNRRCGAGGTIEGSAARQRGQKRGRDCRRDRRCRRRWRCELDGPPRRGPAGRRKSGDGVGWRRRLRGGLIAAKKEKEGGRCRRGGGSWKTGTGWDPFPRRNNPRDMTVSGWGDKNWKTVRRRDYDGKLQKKGGGSG